MMAHPHENIFHPNDFDTLRSVKKKASAFGRNTLQASIANSTVLLVSVSAIVVFYTLIAGSVASLDEASLIGLAIGGIWYVSTIIRCLLNTNCVVENALSSILTITFSLIIDQTSTAGILFVVGIGHALLACLVYSRAFRILSVRYI